jgi:hypothetical protein
MFCALDNNHSAATTQVLAVAATVQADTIHCIHTRRDDKATRSERHFQVDITFSLQHTND